MCGWLPALPCLAGNLDPHSHGAYSGSRSDRLPDGCCSQLRLLYSLQKIFLPAAHCLARWSLAGHSDSTKGQLDWSQSCVHQSLWWRQRRQTHVTAALTESWACRKTAGLRSNHRRLGGGNKYVSGSFLTTRRYPTASEISPPRKFWRPSHSCALTSFIKRAKLMQEVCTEQQPTQ